MGASSVEGVDIYGIIVNRRVAVIIVESKAMSKRNVKMR